MSPLIGRSALLLLVVFFSSTNSVASQASCTVTGDCDIPYTGTVTCQSGVCQTCPYFIYNGNYYNQTRHLDLCHPVCAGPSDDSACSAALGVLNGLCFAMNDPSFSGYTTDKPTMMTPTGDVYYVDGVCAYCADGYVANDAHTTCVPDSGMFSPQPSASPPLSDPPAPTPSSPPLDSSPPPLVFSSPPPDSPSPPSPKSATPPPSPLAPAGNLGAPPSTSNPSANTPITVSASSKGEKGSGAQKWVVGLAVSGAGAVLAGIIGIIFYCFQHRHAYVIVRQRHPLAAAMREQMNLKQVDNFDATPGLQFRSSVQMLADALTDRQVVRPHNLLGHATPALASAMSEVLRERYLSGKGIDEKSLLALFAQDCSDEQAKATLASAVELKIASNAAWSEKLLLPPSTAAAPQAPPSVASMPAHAAKPTAPLWDSYTG